MKENASHFPTTTLFLCFETATALFHSCSMGNALSLGQSREKIKLEKQVCLLLAEGQEARLALPPLHLELPSPPLLCSFLGWRTSGVGYNGCPALISQYQGS